MYSLPHVGMMITRFARGGNERENDHMQVYVIAKPTHDVSQARFDDVRKLETLAVVLNNEGVAKPYIAESFNLFVSEDQPVFVEAIGEVDKLSDKAKGDLGLTFHKVAALRAMAQAEPKVGPGDTAYVTFNRGRDGWNIPTGVFCERPSSAQVVRVFNTLQDYIDDEQKKVVIAKLDKLSPKVRQALNI
jgi:hypothetical protein